MHVSDAIFFIPLCIGNIEATFHETGPLMDGTMQLAFSAGDPLLKRYSPPGIYQIPKCNFDTPYHIISLCTYR